MREKENKLSRFFYSRWFFVLAIGLTVMVVLAFFRSYYQDYQVKHEIEKLQEEARSLEAEKLKSLDFLKYVQSPDFAEEKARTEFNLVKPGEQVGVIISPEKGQLSNGQKIEPVVQSEKLSNPAKWWRLFFGKNFLDN